MKTKLLILIVLLLFACNNAEKPLTQVEKEKNIAEAKNLISTIYQAAESNDTAKMTSTFLDSPDFVSLINGNFGNYEETVKKYPSFMGEYKSQKATILNEKYTLLDDSTILYTSKSKWECKLQNDSIAVYDNCGFLLLLKKTDKDWKVLSWTETY